MHGRREDLSYPNPTTDSPLDIFARVRAILECPPASESMHYMDPQATREMINIDKNANFQDLGLP